MSNQWKLRSVLLEPKNTNYNPLQKAFMYVDNFSSFIQKYFNFLSTAHIHTAGVRSAADLLAIIV